MLFVNWSIKGCDIVADVTTNGSFFTSGLLLGVVLVGTSSSVDIIGSSPEPQVKSAFNIALSTVIISESAVLQTASGTNLGGITISISTSAPASSLMFINSRVDRFVSKLVDSLFILYSLSNITILSANDKLYSKLIGKYAFTVVNLRCLSNISDMYLF